jgi:hypothetical protein
VKTLRVDQDVAGVHDLMLARTASLARRMSIEKSRKVRPLLCNLHMHMCRYIWWPFAWTHFPLRVRRATYSKLPLPGLSWRTTDRCAGGGREVPAEFPETWNPTCSCSTSLVFLRNMTII